MKTYLNIGTNIGDREQNIERAIALIQERLQCTARRSTIVTSRPWGYDSDNMFYNIAILIDLPADTDPFDLLHTLKQIEADMGSLSHRTPTGEYCDRLIDIDIMDIEGISINTDTLNIPHSHLWDRPFFSELYLQLRQP